MRLLKNTLHHAYRRWRLRRLEFQTGLGDAGWALHGLVRTLRPKLCVEIGSARGWSTSLIALALEENVQGRLLAIDPHNENDWNDLGGPSLAHLKRNLRALRLGHRVDIIARDSISAAPLVPAGVDLVFVDGDHSYEGVRRDWETYQPKLSPWGLFAFHDSLWGHLGDPALLSFQRDDMGVPLFLEELRIAGYPLITLHSGAGLTLVQPHPGGRSLLPRTPRANCN
jgi:predicted O-methyltransferase YrrM